MGAYKDYVIVKQIGSGGNANVFLAKDTNTGKDVALKELKIGGKYFDEKKNRFCIETRLVQAIQDSVNGVIPILDYGLPDKEQSDKYWYTMPIAEPILKNFSGDRPVDDIAICIKELADVMTELHKRGIVHRDIKPSNIYLYNGKYCFGDFGLVDYPEKEDLTRLKEAVGAKATIAPEMKRNASESDGKKADVYSLAKTGWMLLTKNDTGFDGTYDSESRMMGLSYILKGEHIVELEELLYDSTREEPELRPTMEEFAEKIQEWIDIRSDFIRSNVSQWKYIQNILFGKYIPSRAVWTDIDDIIEVMNLLGRMPNLNHMFIPSGGGQDFECVEKAKEDGCICVKAFGNMILKPKGLYVENIDKDFIWSYFRLEFDKLPYVFEQDREVIYERLTEDIPGHYISWVCGNYGYYEDDTPLPKGYKIVYRYVNGSFVIFSKSSVYNDISGTYDARHSKMTVEEFRRYIEFLRQLHQKIPYNIFLDYANKNPFATDNNSSDEEEKSRKQREIYYKCKEFIRANYGKWDFTEDIKDYIKVLEGKVAYSIEYILNRDYFDRIYLCNNGKLQKETDEIKRYCVYTREEAIKLIEVLQESVKKECEKTGVEFDVGYESLFNIVIQRNSKPTHLFTVEELKSTLRKGDDYHNNRLVIDEDGFIKLLQECEYPYLYPVRFEEYGAYNNYVGKYANLSDLKEDYLMCLQGWLSYLQRGKAVYMDYVHENTNTEKLIEEIKKYY